MFCLLLTSIGLHCYPLYPSWGAAPSLPSGHEAILMGGLKWLTGTSPLTFKAVVISEISEPTLGLPPWFLKNMLIVGSFSKNDVENYIVRCQTCRICWNLRYKMRYCSLWTCLNSIFFFFFWSVYIWLLYFIIIIRVWNKIKRQFSAQFSLQ